MTLVVSEASMFGIAMVGDSAITITEPDRSSRIESGAAKVQYAPLANVGFAMWGDACVAGRQMDSWLDSFIASNDTKAADVESLGASLERELRSALKSESRTWNQMRRGLHIAGFIHGIPHIYHLHTGGDLANQHEPKLFRDYPYGINLSPEQFREALRVNPCHVRNGYYQHFGALYESFEIYVGALQQLGVDWPGQNLEDRCSFLSLQAEVVALTLQWSGRQQKVDDNISAIGFTPTGLKVDRRIAPRPVAWCGSAAEVIF
jgi:hypothetical protein